MTPISTWGLVPAPAAAKPTPQTQTQQMMMIAMTMAAGISTESRMISTITLPSSENGLSPLVTVELKIVRQLLSRFGGRYVSQVQAPVPKSQAPLPLQKFGQVYVLHPVAHHMTA